MPQAMLYKRGISMKKLLKKILTKCGDIMYAPMRGHMEGLITQSNEAICGKMNEVTAHADAQIDTIWTRTDDIIQRLAEIKESFESIMPDPYEDALLDFRRLHGTHVNITDGALVSSICRPTDILRYSKWTVALEKDFEKFLVGLGYKVDENILLHRKLWEYLFIAQALYERGVLAPTQRGLGFAVGTEPLPALFASFGCDILATDLGSEDPAAASWQSGKQHSSAAEALFRPHLCGREVYDKNVTFTPVNMNSIPTNIMDFDFCWSSCAFEHLGTIDKGMQFIMNMLNCLKPGGIAVHTTEVNISSAENTIEEGPSVIFRQRDLEAIKQMLEAQGHFVEPLDFRLDGSNYDSIITHPPYTYTPHFKIVLDGYLSTSMGLIIRKKAD